MREITTRERKPAQNRRSAPCIVFFIYSSFFSFFFLFFFFYLCFCFFFYFIFFLSFSLLFVFFLFSFLFSFSSFFFFSFFFFVFFLFSTQYWSSLSLRPTRVTGSMHRSRTFRKLFGRLS